MPQFVRSGEKPLPKFMTKFVPERFFGATLQGYVKFGTLQEYNSGEEALEARLRDNQDGVWSEWWRGNVENFSGSMSELKFANVTFAGDGNAVKINHVFHAFAFCATKGPYDRAVHREIINAGNESLTHYVVFDTRLFLGAAGILFRDEPDRRMNIIAGEIEYLKGPKDSERSTDQVRQGIEPRAAEAYMRAAFSKSAIFEHEREFRITAIRNGAPLPEPPLIVNALMGAAASAFREAATTSGCLTR